MPVVARAPRSGSCKATSPMMPIAAVVAAASDWGRLDALINNAGATKHVSHGDLDALSDNDFQFLFGVNTVGPFHMVRAARVLLEAGARVSGRASAVVNISSSSVFDGRGSSIAYTASKAALHSVTLSLARALAPLIRVNAVCPGYMGSNQWVCPAPGGRSRRQRVSPPVTG